MPTIFEAKLDGSNAIKYFHISLVRFYLDQAYENAVKAKDEHKEGCLLASSIMGIIFSAMSIEAFINEVSEDVIPKEKIKDFINLRKTYKKNKGESSVAAKARILFGLKFDQGLHNKIKNGIEEVVFLRNSLVHYKLSEMAGKNIMSAVTNPPTPDGQFLTTIDFTTQPERVDPPFIQKVSGLAAVNCFNSTLSFVNEWGVLHGEDNNVPGLEMIT